MFNNLCGDCKTNFLTKIREHDSPLTPGGPLLRILQEVCMEKSVSPEELKSTSRVRVIVSARKEFARRAQRSNYSTNAIGRALNRDHSTVVYWLNGRKKAVR